MDVSMAIIIGILFLIFTIPVWLIIQAEKRKKKKFIQQLLEIGRQHQLQLAGCDVWHGKAMGIDTGKKGLVFLNQKQPEMGAQVVDLNQVAACKITTGAGDNKVILQFVNKSNNVSAIPSVVFYDVNIDDPTQLDVYREKAKEWVKRIEACL